MGIGLLAQSSSVLGLGLGLGLAVLGIRGAPQVAVVDDGASCGTPSPLAPEPVRIGAEQAHALAGLPGTAFVDCRGATEFQAGHIAGAVSLPAESLPFSDAAKSHIAGAQLVITYCDEACARSSRVAEHISESGFSDVRILQGGMESWISAGYPAESGACPLCDHSQPGTSP